MTKTISFDLRDYLENNYPKLTLDEIDLIASDLHRRWDYSPLIKQVKSKVEETAYYANIKLQCESITNLEEDVGDDIEEGFVHSSEGC
tara:strand:- start:203 stop:466 length:264 start_codon:yes stop_codon:yes gene_type:complete